MKRDALKMYGPQAGVFRWSRARSDCVRFAAATTLAALGLVGCAGDARGPDERALAGLEPAAPTRSERAASPGTPAASRAEPRDERPAAMVAGSPIYWSELRPLLAEAAGGQALEDALLHRLVDRELQVAGLRVTDDDVARERAIFIDSVAAAGVADEAEAAALLETVRVARGLGDARFSSLLARNAKLRKLVQPSIIIGDEDVRQAYRMRYGPKHQARLILVPSASDAQRAASRLAGGESFEAVASELSTDASAARGGLLSPISPADSTYPVSIRRTLEGLAPGQVSQVVALDEGYALLKLERTIPGTNPPPETVEASLRHEVQRVRERVEMDRLARDLLRGAEVVVFDRSLQWSWDQRRGGGGR